MSATGSATDNDSPVGHSTNLVGIPTVAGSTGRLLTDAEEILRTIATDIDAAQKSVLLEIEQASQLLPSMR